MSGDHMEQQLCGLHTEGAFLAAEAEAERRGLTGSRPKRIQMRRVRGFRKPEGAIYVGRPSVFGNPWTTAWVIQTGLISKSHSEFAAVANYRAWLTWADDKRLSLPPDNELRRYEEQRVKLLDKLESLRGHDLMCWCPLDKPCHADVLLEIANR